MAKLNSKKTEKIFVLRRKKFGRIDSFFLRLNSSLVCFCWLCNIFLMPKLFFPLDQISQAKRRGSASVSLDGIYRCLNRTILYMLARPQSKSDDVTSQVPEYYQGFRLNLGKDSRMVIFGELVGQGLCN
jgi:hypothetical protein